MKSLMKFACAIVLLMMGAPARTQQPVSWESPNPSVAQLHEYLQGSYGRSLIARHVAPLHLVAQVEFLGAANSADNPSAQATLEELWQDPLHWKLNITLGGSARTEVDNGAKAYIVGHIAGDPSCCTSFPGHLSAEDVIRQAQGALFGPFRPALLSTRRLMLDSKPNCIDANPELTGVSIVVPVAKVVYCLRPSDLDLRYAEYPQGSSAYTIDFSDFAAFAGRDIARTIDISAYGIRIARVHIVTLEAASDFHAIDAPPPAGAKRGTAHGQSEFLADELMPGRPLSDADVRDLESKINDSSCICTASLRLHADVSGRVASYKIAADPYSLINQIVIAGAMNLRFSLGYQGDNAVPFDYDLTLWHGTP